MFLKRTILIVFMLLNSKNISPHLTRMVHLSIWPLPLPILEFLDFFEIIKFGKINIHTLFCFTAHLLFFNLFFLKFFLIDLFSEKRYFISNWPSCSNLKPTSPYCSWLCFSPSLFRFFCITGFVVFKSYLTNDETI
jgi:hypothetical protein